MNAGDHIYFIYNKRHVENVHNYFSRRYKFLLEIIIKECRTVSNVYNSPYKIIKYINTKALDEWQS